MSDVSGAPTRATLFHAGSTCPFCQEAISEGQMVVRCPKCGSLHHDTCWSHNHGCASYHCDTKVRAQGDQMRPELVITAAEADAAVVPPPRKRMTPAEAATPFVARRPSRLSWLAVAAAVLAGAAAGGFYGAVTGNAAIVVAGIAAAIASIAVGVAALVVINTGRKVYGFAPAGAAIVLSGFFIMFFLVRLHALTTTSLEERMTDLGIYNSMPTDEELARLEPWRAHAMRANVIMRTPGAGAFSAGAHYGSGVTMRVAEGTAYILTNKHVVDSAGKGGVAVVFYNGEESRGTVDWRAEDDMDVAIVSCQALTIKDFAPVELAEGVAAQGERVFAIGNPMYLSWSYTEGVISGVRHQTAGGRSITVYQTQTPINPGNSGGGLYNMSGRLIGINTWTKDKSVAEGLNFAVSAASALGAMGETEKQRLLGPGRGPAVGSTEGSR